jgi:hypothetical protein
LVPRLRDDFAAGYLRLRRVLLAIVFGAFAKATAA